MTGVGILAILDKSGYMMTSLFASIAWQSTVLFSAIAVLSFFLRKQAPSLRYKLWISALLVLPFIPAITSGFEYLVSIQKEISVIPEYHQPKQQPSTVISVSESAPTSESSQVTVPEETQPLPHSQPSIIVSEQALPREITENNTSAIDLVTQYPWAIVPIVYFLGLAVFSTLIIAGRLRIRNWIQKGEAIIDNTVFDLFSKAAEEIGVFREFILIESEDVHAPLTCRTRRPVIILPRGLTDSLSAHDLYSIALHELAHIKRNDVMALSLLSLIRALFFFHPLVWIAIRQVSYLAELSCDEQVIQHSHESAGYADMLTRIASSLPTQTMSSELAAGFIFSKNMFVYRVRAILDDSHRNIKRLSKLALMGISAMAGMSLVVALALPLGQKDSANGEGLTVSGIVTRNDTPVQGAKVYVVTVRFDYRWDRKGEIIATAKSGRDGRFTCKLPATVKNIFIMQYAIRAYKEGKGATADFLKMMPEHGNYHLELGKTESIEGTVTNSEGKAVKGAEVYLTDMPEQVKKTDRKGRYRIDSVAKESSNMISVVAKGYGKVFRRDIFKGMREVDFSLEKEGMITGKVIYGDSGKPAKGIRLYAVNVDHAGPSSEIVTTDRKGRYILKNISAGIYHVTIENGNEMPEYVAKAVENIEVTAGETVEDIDLTLEEGVIVSGMVTGGEKSLSIENATVTVVPESINSRYIIGRVSTDKEGRFAIRTISDEFTIYASPPIGYLDDHNTSRRTIDPDENFETINFYFEKGITVKGRLLEPDGSPAADISVESPVSWTGWFPSVRTDADGSFELIGLQNGNKYQLNAIDKRKKLFLETVFEAIPGESIELELIPYETASIQGQVVDETGEPVSGAIIMKRKRIYNPNQPHRSGFAVLATSSASTDTNGHFQVENINIEEELDSFTAEASGYKMADLINMASLKPGLNDAGIVELAFSETHNKQLFGKVVDPGGKPITGAAVRINRGYADLKQDYTGKNGGFRLEGIKNDIEGEVSISHDDYGWYKFIYVPANTMRTYTLQPLTGTISGVITDSDGKPLEGIGIDHHDENFGPSGIVNFYTQSDKNGRFEVTNLVENSYDLTFRSEKNGYRKILDVAVNTRDLKVVMDSADSYVQTPRQNAIVDYVRNNRGRRKALIDKPAPQIEAGEWLTGDPVSLEELKGKVVLLYFWNTNESLTVQPLSVLKHWQKKYGDDIAVVAVHGHTKGSGMTQRTLNEYNIEFPVFTDSATDIEGTDGRTFNNYALRSITHKPCLTLIDKRGHVSKHFKGLISGTQLPIHEIEDKIDVLLEESWSNNRETIKP